MSRDGARGSARWREREGGGAHDHGPQNSINSRCSLSLRYFKLCPVSCHGVAVVGGRFRRKGKGLLAKMGGGGGAVIVLIQKRSCLGFQENQSLMEGEC